MIASAEDYPEISSSDNEALVAGNTTVDPRIVTAIVSARSPVSDVSPAFAIRAGRHRCLPRVG